MIQVLAVHHGPGRCVNLLLKLSFDDLGDVSGKYALRHRLKALPPISALQWAPAPPQ